MSPSETDTPARAYATLLGRRDGSVDVLLANQERQKFVIRPAPLLALLSHPGEPVQVKRRDRRPWQAVHYHGGDIWGVLNEADGTASLVFYFGELARDLFWPEGESGPRNLLAIQEFLLPCEDLRQLEGVFSMLAQQEEVCRFFVNEADFRPDMTLTIATDDLRRSRE